MEGKTLFLKTPPTLDTALGGIKLDQSGSVSFKDSISGYRKELRKLPRQQSDQHSCPAVRVTDPSKDCNSKIHPEACTSTLRVASSCLIRCKACSTGGNSYWTWLILANYLWLERPRIQKRTYCCYFT